MANRSSKRSRPAPPAPQDAKHSPTPHFSHSHSNRRQPVTRREPSPPAFFSWGRRCRRRMRGVGSCQSVDYFRERAWETHENKQLQRENRPPHPASPPSPPARNRGGRRALDEGSGSDREGTIQVSVCPANHGRSIHDPSTRGSCYLNERRRRDDADCYGQVTLIHDWVA